MPLEFSDMLSGRGRRWEFSLGRVWRVVLFFSGSENPKFCSPGRIEGIWEINKTSFTATIQS